MGHKQNLNFCQISSYKSAYPFVFIRFWLSFTLLLVFVVSCTSSREAQVCNIAATVSSNLASPDVSTYFDNTINGRINSVFIRDNYAFLGTNTSFGIFDISNPKNPEQVSAIPLSVNSIEVIDHYAYLTGNDLHIFDISNPRIPVEVYCKNNPSFELTNVAVDGDYAYLAKGTDGLQILDISNPSVLVEVSSYKPQSAPQFQLLPQPKLIESQPRLVMDVVTYDRYVYIAESLLGIDSLYGGLITIFDISNPRKPEIVNTYEMPNNVGTQKLFVGGNYLFVSSSYIDSPSTLMLDISDPANPVEVAIPTLPNGLIATFENYAFFTPGSSQLQVWDISNPYEPIQYVWEDLNYGYTIDVVISGNYAYFATQYGGFRIVDITDPRHPITISISFD